MSGRRELEDAAIVLGCPEDTPLANAEKVYRQLARRFHPDVDRSPLAEARMRDLNAAIAAFRRRSDHDRDRLHPVIDTSIFDDGEHTVVVRSTEGGVSFRVFIDGRESYTLLRYPTSPNVLYARDVRGRAPAVIGDYQAWTISETGVIEPYAFADSA